MKQIVYTLTFLFISIATVSAQYFTVGQCSGTPAGGLGTNTYGPMYSVATANAASRTAIIYPASQLTSVAGSPLTSIYFYRLTSSGTMAGTPNYKIYLKEVASADWGATFASWSDTIASATLVYDGNPASIVGSTSGWKAFPFLTNFNYSGIRNLAVLTEYTNTTVSADITWTYEYTGSCINTSNSNTTKYSNNTTGTLPNSLGSSNYRRPYVGFDVYLTCYPPTNITPANITTTAAQVSWTASTSTPSGGYEYYYSTSNTAPTASTTPTGTVAAGTTSAQLTALTSGTTYYVWVRSACSSADKSPWSNAVSFITAFTAPANDNICGAVSLTASSTPTCTTILTNQTTGGATAGATACVGSGADDDVWYSFVATNTTHIITLTDPATTPTGSSNDRVHQLYSSSDNTCNGTLTSLKCSDPETSTTSGLVIGNTYFVRVHSYSTGNYTTFSICVTAPPPPPANDNICGAVSLRVSSGTTCSTSLTNQSTQGATQSLAGCAGTADEDIWYSFVATNTTHYITLSNSGAGSTDRVHQVFSSSDNTCTGTLTSVLCSDPETSTINGLTVGSTYFVRVYSYGSTNYATFDICVTSPAACPTPTAVSVNSVTSTTASVNFTSTGNSFIVEYGATGFTPGTGATAGTGGTVVTATSSPVLLTGLTLSTTYQVYVRQNCTVAGNGYSANSSAVSFTTSALPPANDTAAGAITLTVGPSFNTTAYTNVAATQAANEKYASCYQSATTGTGNTIATHTVWFKFVAPAGGAVKVSTDTSAGTLSDTHLGLFSATNASDYNTFNIISCDDDNGAVSSLKSILYATGLTPGQTYYISVDGYNGSTGTFYLAVSSLASSMLATTATCTSSTQTPSGTQTSYAGQVPMADGSGNLIAIVQNPAGGSVSAYTVNQNVNTGAVRNSQGTYYLDRNFRISNSSATNVNVQLFFLNSELTALQAVDPLITLANIGVTRQTETVAGCNNNFDTSKGPISFIAQSGNGTAGQVSWINFMTPGFSNFYLHRNGTALPIKFEYLTGKKAGSTNALNWKVTCTSTSITMVLERSADARTFNQTITSINATQARCGQPFDAVDASPLNGISYYRLKMIDVDGKVSYSPVAAVINGKAGAELVGIYPTVVKDQAYLSVTSSRNATLQLSISDMSGKLLKTINQPVISGSSMLPVNTSSLASGVYNITGMLDGVRTQTLRFVKQ